MKYEIIKGSHKDFEFCDDDVLTKYRIIGHDVVTHSTHSSKKLKSCSLGHTVDVIAERRPVTEPVWSGEGLPPVGALCRYRAFSDMPWVECEVLGWHGDDAWMKRTEDGITFVMGNPELFPIRSPEDVARDEAIEDIGNVINPSSQSARDILAPAIYDAIAAGKIRHVKLEGK